MLAAAVAASVSPTGEMSGWLRLLDQAQPPAGSTHAAGTSGEPPCAPRLPVQWRPAPRRPIATGPIDTGPIDTGPIDTGSIDTGQVRTVGNGILSRSGLEGSQW